MNSSAGLVGGSDPLVIELPVQRDQDNCHSFSTHVTSSSPPLTPSSTKSLELLEKKMRETSLSYLVSLYYNGKGTMLKMENISPT